MGAVIVDSSGTALTVDATSKAARLTLYDANGKEIVKKPTLGSYMAFILIRQSAGTAAPNTVYSLFNPSLTTLMRIRTVEFTQYFDGTATLAGITYAWYRTAGATPTGGTAITPTKKRSGDPASVADVRFLDSGLTMTGNTRQGEAFIRTNMSINTVSGTYEPFGIHKASGFRRLTAPFEVGPKQGISCILNLANAAVGMGMAGYIEWDEESL